MTRFHKILIVLVLLISCNLFEVSGQDNRYYLEFYKAFNSLVHSKYSKITQIIDKTWTVYRTAYGESPYPKETVDSLPQPPPPGNIYYDMREFQYLVMSHKLDSIDINYMYKSIDSTKTFIIDQKRTELRVIPWENVNKILRNSEGDFDQSDSIIEKTYGAQNFMIVSTPVFNAEYTTLIITIKRHHGYEDLSGITYVMSKKGKEWRIVKGSKVLRRKFKLIP